MSANYGLFSGFASKVDYYSNKFKLDDVRSFKSYWQKKTSSWSRGSNF